MIRLLLHGALLLLLQLRTSLQQQQQQSTSFTISDFSSYPDFSSSPLLQASTVSTDKATCVDAQHVQWNVPLDGSPSPTGRYGFVISLNKIVGPGCALGSRVGTGRVTSVKGYDYGDASFYLRVAHTGSSSTSSLPPNARTCFGFVARSSPSSPSSMLSAQQALWCFSAATPTQATVSYSYNGTQHSSTVDLPFDASQQYHTYAAQWRADGMQWLVDGSVVATQTQSGARYPSGEMLISIALFPAVNGSGYSQYTCDALVSVGSVSYLPASLSPVTFAAPSIPLQLAPTTPKLSEDAAALLLEVASLPNRVNSTLLPTAAATPARGAPLAIHYTLTSSRISLPSQALRPQLSVQSNGGRLDITLTLRAVTRTIPNILVNKTTSLSFTTRTLCLDERCLSPAPTLLVWPGDAVRFTLINALEASASSNLTGLSVHGLRLPANFNSDIFNSSLRVAGGQSHVFSFTVPATQPPGLHYYSSPEPLDVMSGALGAIAVQPLKVSAMTPEFASLSSASLVLVLTHTMLGRNANENPHQVWVNESAGPGASATLPGALCVLASLPQLYAQAGSAQPINDNSYGSPTTALRDFWLVNGQYQPSIALLPTQGQIFDLLAGSLYRLLELEVRSGVGYNQGDQTCLVQLLALDGVYLTSPRDTTHLVLLPGQRASICVTCPLNGIYYLQTVSTTAPDSRYSGVGDVNTKSNQVLAVFNVAGFPPSPVITLGPQSLVGLGSSDGTMRMATATASNDPSTLPAPSSELSLSTVQAGSGQNGFLGAGSDCTLPCFSSKECVALYGSNFSVNAIPSVRVGKCRFSGNNSLVPATPLPGSADSHHDVLEISIWGTADFSFPLRFSSPVQFISFTPAVSVYGSGYSEPQADRAPIKPGFTSRPAVPIYPEPPSVYALPGDWRDVYPALAGKMLLRGVAGNDFSFRVSSLGAGMAVTVQPATGQAATTLPAASALPSLPLSTTFQPTLEVQGGTPANASLLSLAQLSPMLFTPAGSGNSALLCDGLGTSWGYLESIDVYRAQRVLTVNGCPNHAFQCQEVGCGGLQSGTAFIQPTRVSLPLYPQFAASPLDVTCSLEPVGYALNGVPFFSQAEVSSRVPTRLSVAQNSMTSIAAPVCMTPANYFGTRGISAMTQSPSHPVSSALTYPQCPLTGPADGLLYCGDAVKHRAGDIDSCGGSADDLGRYGYRIEPVCLAGQLASAAKSNSSRSSRGVQLGWAMDGFPIFGPTGPHNLWMLPCNTAGADTLLCLDSCGGYAGSLPDHDLFLYRYFLASDPSAKASAGACSSNVTDSNLVTVPCNRLDGPCCLSNVPANTRSPYTIGCLVGCLPGQACVPTSATTDITGTATAGGSGATESRYQPLQSAGVLPAGVFARPVSAAPLAPASPSTSASTTTPASTATTPSAPPTDPLTAAYLQQLRRRASLHAFLTRATSTTLAAVVETPTPLVLSLNVDREMVLLTGQTQSATPSDIGGTVEVMQPGDQFFGVAAGPLSTAGGPGTLFYTAQNGVFAVPLPRALSTNSTTPVLSQNQEPLIAGILRVSILGWNFGKSLANVIRVVVRGQACNSVQLLSPSNITCVMTQSGFTQTTGPSAITGSDVYLAVVGGEAFGSDAHLSSELEASRSGRPVIDSIVLTSVPFKPHAVAIIGSRGGHAASLYFSSVATGGGVVYRSFADGSQVEGLAYGLEKAYGVAVVPADCASGIASHDGAGVCDLLLLAHTLGVSAVLLPAMVPGQVLSNPPLPVLLVSPLQSPVSISVDVPGGRVFIAVQGDRVGVLPLSTVSATLTNGAEGVVAQLTPLLSLESGCRLSATLVLPPMPGVADWAQVRLLALDSNNNRLLSASESFTAPQRLGLYDGWADSAVLWPTALTLASHNDKDSSSTLYVAELLGKIWRVTLTRKVTNAGTPATAVSVVLAPPQLVLDLSAYAASGRLRGLYNSNNKNVLLDVFL